MRKPYGVQLVTVLAGAAMAMNCWAGLLYEPGNYVAQDNLVVNLDGIRNAGPLKAHDSTATEWKNIGRAANDATITLKDGDTSAWVADGFHFAGGAFGKLKGTQNLGNSMTVQIVCDVKGSECSTTWPTFFGCAEDWANIYFSDRNTGLVHFKADVITGLEYKNRANVTCGANVKYLNAALNSSAHKQIVAADASFETGWKEGSGGTRDAPGSLYWYFGSCGASQSALDSRYLVGTIKAIRVYNKVLSNTELAANRAIDEVRFFTGIPVTNVVVTTSVAGLDGNEGGVYAYDEEGYTFTAPQKATKDGVVYSCTGYTLETWNGSAWSSPVSCASCAYTATDTNAKVRLTWQWARAHAAIPTALDPLFDDYVTDGLIFQLDGIRNVGADKPHDSSSSEWIDLVHGNVGSFQHDYADDSTWKEDGYYFGGRSFAQFFSSIPKVTNTVTVQVVCDITTNALVKFKTSRNPNVLWPNLVSSANDDKMNIYYDMNSGRSRLTFKNASGGNTDLANGVTNGDNWEGRYVTAIRNGNVNYILQTTNIANAASKDAASAFITNGTIRVGGANTSIDTRQQRWFLGTIKAVRVYDRVLSDAELAQNRVIDEARFFGAPLSSGVVVASSVRGVNGNEPEGEYALPAGGYTFTAPATVTVGEDTYSCTGYTLETWDGSAWGTPDSSASLSCALTDTSAKYRLAWQWSHTAGPGYDAAFSDYVTDGLVVHLDGIRNAGSQAMHDNGAMTWTDLSTKGGAVSFVNNGAVTTSGWRADGYYFNGASYGIVNGARTLDGPFTVQTVLDFDRVASHRTDAYYPMIIGTTEPGDKFSIYCNQENRTDSQVFTKVLGSSALGGISNWAGDYMTVLANGSQVALFPEATPATWVGCANVPGTRTFTFASSNGSDSNPWGRRMLTGTIKSVRVYGRVLSDAELEQNRAADEVRFFGRAPAATGALIVVSDVEGLSGDQPNGAYRPVDGYAFTAPAEAVVDGVLYECAGYTLEIWNGSAWGSAVSYESRSYTADVSSASKRLTWNWRIASRLTKVQGEFDVGDYVQNGLYLHFDGIRNVGKTADHDDNAATWVNLGTGGAKFNATFDFEKSGATASSWATDGYNFTDGGKFAKLANYPTLGSFLTVQIVCDVRAGTSSYPTLFGSTNDFCNIYAFTAGTRLFFKVWNQSGRPELSPQSTWKGQFANGGWVDGKCAVYQSATPDPSIWVGKWRDTTLGALDGAAFYIGGVYFPASTSDTDKRRLAGKIQAIRVYTRSLSDEELAHNRMVDEARFKGNPPAANLTVVNVQPEGASEAVQSSVEDGAYNLTGSVTVTADAVRIDGVKYVPSYVLETYESGVWTRTSLGSGDSFTVTAEDKPQRLTCKWMPRGAVIIVR
ncbi:MAG: hypothetical protein IJH50_12975 [Kiritimatiellae bacterium]|nr:hypothetical protein [Kiritimatiellia bacterium]